MEAEKSKIKAHSWAWWHRFVNPKMWEAEAGRLQVCDEESISK